jgi:hypothetical protein
MKGPRNGREIVVSLKTDMPEKVLGTIRLLQARLKADSIACPNAVFMGGSPEQSYLASFVDALGTKDFSLLWGVCAA